MVIKKVLVSSFLGILLPFLCFAVDPRFITFNGVALAGINPFIFILFLALYGSFWFGVIYAIVWLFRQLTKF